MKTPYKKKQQYFKEEKEWQTKHSNSQSKSKDGTKS